MKWFRSNIKSGARLALLALFVQLALSFGHLHALAVPSADATTTALASAAAVDARDLALDSQATSPQAPAGAARQVSEHAPVQTFIRHLVWGPMVFLAGMTCEQFPDLKRQYHDILPRARALLRETGCDWTNVVRVSVFLHRDEDPDALLAGIAAAAPVPLEQAEIEFVDGYSRPGKRLEIEITARR